MTTTMKEHLNELRSAHKNNAAEAQVFRDQVRDVYQHNLELEEKLKFRAQANDTQIHAGKTENTNLSKRKDQATSEPTFQRHQIKYAISPAWGTTKIPLRSQRVIGTMSDIMSKEATIS